MKHKAINDSISIDAPKETVWKVLVTDELTRAWYAEFSEGSHAITDWKQGSKAIFTDNSMFGLIGRITDNKTAERLSITYEGILHDGVEDYESEKAAEMKGAVETYTLSEENGKTTMSVHLMLPEEFYDMMSEAWTRALGKIKQLAESL
jgi:uncharacterized protein YndB with AHSA1/START domain